MNGWIKLHRSMLSNPLWESEPFSRAQAWIDLLLITNHKDGFIRIKNGKRIDIKRGQCGYSEVKLSERWKWSRGKVKRFLNELKNDQMIVQQIIQQNSVITICNYESFQGDSTANGTANGTANDTIDGQLTDTNKKDNKDKKEKITSDDVAEVFEYWQSIMGKQKSKLVDKRERAIRARLKEGYTISDIKSAIDGCKNSEYHQGKNDRGTVYDDIELICRDGTRIEFFINNKPQQSKPIANLPQSRELTPTWRT